MHIFIGGPASFMVPRENGTAIHHLVIGKRIFPLPLQGLFTGSEPPPVYTVPRDGEGPALGRALPDRPHSTWHSRGWRPPFHTCTSVRKNKTQSPVLPF